MPFPHVYLLTKDKITWWIIPTDADFEYMALLNGGYKSSVNVILTILKNQIGYVQTLT
jgi:hypothetical protein